MATSTLALLFILILPAIASAQEREWSRFEMSGASWILSPSGTIQSSGTQVDIESDLGIRDSAARFLGRLTLKPARKHSLIFEGIPYRLEGDNLLNRQIVFGNKTYNIQERITSNADLNYFFGGYRYDLVSGGRGFFGLLGGAALFDASGTIRSTTFGVSSNASVTVPMPLAGAEFRAFLLPHSRLLSLGGEIKGMSFGGYGDYIQGSFDFGAGLGRHVSLQAGYKIVNVDVHKRTQPEGVDLRLQGPVVSIQFRDR